MILLIEYQDIKEGKYLLRLSGDESTQQFENIDDALIHTKNAVEKMHKEIELKFGISTDSNTEDDVEPIKEDALVNVIKHKYEIREIELKGATSDEIIREHSELLSECYHNEKIWGEFISTLRLLEYAEILKK